MTCIFYIDANMRTEYARAFKTHTHKNNHNHTRAHIQAHAPTQIQTQSLTETASISHPTVLHPVVHLGDRAKAPPSTRSIVSIDDVTASHLGHRRNRCLRVLHAGRRLGHPPADTYDRLGCHAITMSTTEPDGHSITRRPYT